MYQYGDRETLEGLTSLIIKKQLPGSVRLGMLDVGLKL